MSKGLMDKLLDKIFDEEWAGRRGEKLTERELKLVQLFGRKGKILRNVYLPKDNGETSEVDVIFITQKGIFVFESKNYSGWIFGDEKSQYWTAMLPNKMKNQFYNPIRQNRTHIKWMSKFVGENIPLFSIIVFSERCELKKVEVQSDDIKVIKRDVTYKTVKNIWDENPDVVTEDQIDLLYEQLKVLTNVDASVKIAHVESIEKRYKTESIFAGNETAIKNDMQYDRESAEKESVSEERAIGDNAYNMELMMNCPRCGGNLVSRVAKKGPNAGNQFWGCENFPKCRYIKD